MTTTAPSQPQVTGNTVNVQGPAASTGATTATELGTAKLTVALPVTAVQAIEQIAASRHKTKTQVLREAIALKTYIEREMAKPETHLLLQRGEDVTEIVFTESA
jgi:hypothetical protein